MLGTKPQPSLMQFLSVLAGQGSISENISEINHKKLHSNNAKLCKYELIKCEGPTKTTQKFPCVLMKSNNLIELASSSIALNTTLIAFAVEIHEGIYTETS